MNWTSFEYSPYFVKSWNRKVCGNEIILFFFRLDVTRLGIEACGDIPEVHAADIVASTIGYVDIREEENPEWDDRIERSWPSPEACKAPTICL